MVRETAKQSIVLQKNNWIYFSCVLCVKMCAGRTPARAAVRFLTAIQSPKYYLENYRWLCSFAHSLIYSFIKVTAFVLRHGVSVDNRTGYWRAGLTVLIILVFGRAVDARTDPVIEQITIECNVLISTERLLDLMVTRPAGLVKKRRFNPAVFRADIKAIENFYENSGFLDVRARPFRDLLDNEKRVRIRIVIDEGPRYIVHAVNIIGNHYLADDEIQRILLTRKDQPYFRLFVAADRRAIQGLADRRALLDANISVNSSNVDDTEYTVTVNFFITEGKPVRVGDIEIRGLQKTKPEVVLRELAIRSGDLYDNARLIRSQTQLFQTGLFRSIRLEPRRPDSVSTSRNLLVSVTELPGGEISFGGGFASVEQLRGSVEVTQRNWLGHAVTIGMNGQASKLIQRIDAGITQPWMFRTRTVGTLRGFFERQEQPGSHTRWEFGSSLSAGRILSRTFRSLTTYTIKQIHIDPGDSLKQIFLQRGSVEDSLRTRREGSLTQRIIYDTRDDILNPERGFYAHLQGNLASPWLGSSSGNENSLFSINVTLRKYLPIRRFPDLATSVSVGYVRPLSSGTVPIDRRLFLGGDKSVRGFGIGDIGNPDGGVIAVSSQNEMRFQLPYIDLAGFIDLGGVASTVEDLSLSHIRVGFGGGIRVMSPIGLLRTDVGFHRAGTTEQGIDLLFDRTFFYLGLGQAF